jgi:hypothetical protein
MNGRRGSVCVCERERERERETHAHTHTHTQTSSRVRVRVYSYLLIQCAILAYHELLYKEAPTEQHSTVMRSKFTWLHNYIQGFILRSAFSVNFAGSLMYSLRSNLQNLHGNQGKTLSYLFKLWNFCSVTGIYVTRVNSSHPVATWKKILTVCRHLGKN